MPPTMMDPRRMLSEEERNRRRLRAAIHFRQLQMEKAEQHVRLHGVSANGIGVSHASGFHAAPVHPYNVALARHNVSGAPGLKPSRDLDGELTASGSGIGVGGQSNIAGGSSSGSNFTNLMAEFRRKKQLRKSLQGDENEEGTHRSRPRSPAPQNLSRSRSPGFEYAEIYPEAKRRKVAEENFSDDSEDMDLVEDDTTPVRYHRRSPLRQGPSPLDRYSPSRSPPPPPAAAVPPTHRSAPYPNPTPYYSNSDDYMHTRIPNHYNTSNQSQYIGRERDRDFIREKEQAYETWNGRYSEHVMSVQRDSNCGREASKVTYVDENDFEEVNAEDDALVELKSKLLTDMKAKRRVAGNSESNRFQDERGDSPRHSSEFGSTKTSLFNGKKALSAPSQGAVERVPEGAASASKYISPPSGFPRASATLPTKYSRESEDVAPVSAKVAPLKLMQSLVINLNDLSEDEEDEEDEEEEEQSSGGEADPSRSNANVLMAKKRETTTGGNVSSISSDSTPSRSASSGTTVPLSPSSASKALQVLKRKIEEEQRKIYEKRMKAQRQAKLQIESQRQRVEELRKKSDLACAKSEADHHNGKATIISSPGSNRVENPICAEGQVSVTSEVQQADKSARGVQVAGSTEEGKAQAYSEASTSSSVDAEGGIDEDMSVRKLELDVERKSKELEPLLVELATLQRKQVCAMSQKQFVQQKLDALQSQMAKLEAMLLNASRDVEELEKRKLQVEESVSKKQDEVVDLENEIFREKLGIAEIEMEEEGNEEFNLS